MVEQRKFIADYAIINGSQQSKKMGKNRISPFAAFWERFGTSRQKKKKINEIQRIFFDSFISMFVFMRRVKAREMSAE